MKLYIFFLSLLTIGGVYARSVQYAIINTMTVPITNIDVYYGEYGANETRWDKEEINEKNQPGGFEPGGLQPHKVFAWNAENKRETLRLGAASTEFDAYAHRIIVTPQGKGQVSTNLKESYDDMYWVIKPDGHVKRVYQIYYDGTIIPFKNDKDLTQGPVEPKYYIKPDQPFN